jgi:hypothetical protein
MRVAITLPPKVMALDFVRQTPGRAELRSLAGT